MFSSYSYINNNDDNNYKVKETQQLELWEFYTFHSLNDYQTEF